MLFLEEEEWVRDSKTHFYLAQIAREIRQVLTSFSAKKQEVNLDDFLLKPEGTLRRPKKEPRKVEVGEDLVKNDPKWAAVDANAKATWLARMGAALGRVVRGNNNPPGT